MLNQLDYHTIRDYLTENAIELAIVIASMEIAKIMALC